MARRYRHNLKEWLNRCSYFAGYVPVHLTEGVWIPAVAKNMRWP